MLRDIFTNKWILSCFGFLVIFAGLCYLWYQNEIAPYKEQIANLDEIVHQFEKPQTATTTKLTEQAAVASEESITPTPENPINEVGTESTDKDSKPQAKQPSLETASAENAPISPFGFGPYPEVPTDYPYPKSIPWHWDEEYITNLEETLEKALEVRGVSFTEHMKISELMSRVGIKLWNEGQTFDGLISSDQTGLIYPDNPDVLYVEWHEVTLPNGDVKRYMSGTIGSALSSISIAAQQGLEPPPDWLEIRSFQDGIDPYEFLGLKH